MDKNEAISYAIAGRNKTLSAAAIKKYGEPNFPWDEAGCHFNPHKKTILTEECLTNYLTHDRRAWDKWVVPNLETELE